MNVFWIVLIWILSSWNGHSHQTYSNIILAKPSRNIAEPKKSQNTLASEARDNEGWFWNTMCNKWTILIYNPYNKYQQILDRLPHYSTEWNHGFNSWMAQVPSSWNNSSTTSNSERCQSLSFTQLRFAKWPFDKHMMATKTNHSLLSSPTLCTTVALLSLDLVTFFAVMCNFHGSPCPIQRPQTKESQIRPPFVQKLPLQISTCLSILNGDNI